MKNGVFTLKRSAAKEGFAEDSAAMLAPRKKVAIVGARGYSGLELARLLLRHPSSLLTACFATSGFCLDDYLPELSAKHIKQIPGLAIEELFPFVKNGGAEIVFLATPVETSLALAPELLKLGVHVIDLSGAFRLQVGGTERRVENYKKWYNTQHAVPDLLERAELGLVPWVQTRESRSEPPKEHEPRLIANPGCFATAASMAILPLLQKRIIEERSLVIDAKSGTSGAGRKAEERLLYNEVDGLCLPYRIGNHQHEPEIQQLVQKFAGCEIEPFFTTHLLPVRRGIIASIYARVNSSLQIQEQESVTKQIEAAYQEAYANDPLVEHACLDERGADKLLNLRRVVGSARTQIAYRVVADRIYVFSLIDNLMKGAASQAVENFNRLCGLATWTGLTEMEGVL